MAKNDEGAAKQLGQVPSPLWSGYHTSVDLADEIVKGKDTSTSKHRLKLTPEDILLIMDTLIAAGNETWNFPVGRQYKGKPTQETEKHLAELYQIIGQAMGEKNIILEFEVEDD